ncbi:hypothetical protein Emag_006196 [Eimeria magna]
MSPRWSGLILAALSWAGAQGKAAHVLKDVEPEAEVEAGMTQAPAPMGAFFSDTLVAPADSKPLLRHWAAEWGDPPVWSHRGAEADLTHTWTNEEGLTVSQSLDVNPESVILEKTEAEHREEVSEKSADLSEENPLAAKRTPLKGIKSLVIGGLLLVLLGVMMSTEFSEYDDELVEEGFGDKLVDSWWAIEDYVDERIPALPIIRVIKMLLLAAGPVLAVSGLLDFVVSLRNRYTQQRNRSTLLMRGMVLMAVPSVILALALFTIPEPHAENAENFSEAQEDFEVLAQVAWGMHLVGVAMVIVGAIKARNRRKPQRDSALDTSHRLTREVDELWKSMRASSAIPRADMNEVLNSEYAQLAHR